MTILCSDSVGAQERISFALGHGQGIDRWKLTLTACLGEER